jgi:hypothetical protein
MHPKEVYTVSRHIIAFGCEKMPRGYFHHWVNFPEDFWFLSAALTLCTASGGYVPDRNRRCF